MKTIAVIPAWNEAASLGPLLAEAGALPPGVLDRIVVVDANSLDATADVARSAGAQVVRQGRPGYGAACWQGLHTACEMGAAVVVFLDGDGSDPPDAVPSLVEPIARGEADLVLGVRCTPRGHACPIPWHARAGNALVCLLLWLRTGRRVADLPSMKAASVARLAELDMTEMGYGWTTEMIAKALSHGLRMRQVPVFTRPRTAGVSKVSGNPMASVRAGWTLVRTALRAA